jgi:hypothetical protein
MIGLLLVKKAQAQGWDLMVDSRNPPLRRCRKSNYLWLLGVE